MDLHDQTRRSVYEQKIKSDPSNVSALWGYAKLLFSANEISTATEILGNILKINERNFDAGLLMAECLTLNGKSEEAIRHLRKMEGWYPDNARLLKKMVAVALENEDIPSAKAYLDKLIQLWPSQSETWVTNAEFLTKTENRIKALKAWEKAFQVDNSNPKARLHLGIDACITHQFERAKVLLAPVVPALNGEEPNTTLANYHIAYCYQMLGYEPNRILPFIEYINPTCLDLQNQRIRENLTGFWTLAAKKEFENENYPESIEFVKLIEKYGLDINEPENFAKYWFSYAGFLYENGNTEEALKHISKAIELAPANKDYLKTRKIYKKEFRSANIKTHSKSLKKLIKPGIAASFVLAAWLLFPLYREPVIYYQAVFKNNIQAFDQYIEQYPEGQYVENAIVRGEKALWNTISKAPTVADCDLYLERFPEGEFVEAVLESKEDAVWNAAMDENTIEAYFKYFEAYPDGKYNVRIGEDGQNHDLPGTDPNLDEKSGHKYVKAVMRDADGYTNIRKGKGTKYAVISKVYKNQPFLVQPLKEQNWWKVILADGTRGFIHKSRVNLN